MRYFHSRGKHRDAMSGTAPGTPYYPMSRDGCFLSFDWSKPGPVVETYTLADWHERYVDYEEEDSEQVAAIINNNYVRTSNAEISQLITEYFRQSLGKEFPY
jgi:hypothetical protein